MKPLHYAIALALLSGAMSGNNNRSHFEDSETDEERNKMLERAKIDRYKSNGLREFYYGDKSLWALNQKSADKKAKRMGWI
jgi:hypothetical protein